MSNGLPTLPWLIAFAIALALIVVLAATLARERRSRAALTTTLAREARHDAATALPNQRFFHEWLGYALAQARRESRELGLLLIEIDGDAQGRIAEQLQALKREGDLLAAMEPGVFGLVATATARGDELRGLAERMLRELSTSTASHPAPRANVGIAIFPEDADDLPGLVAAAGSALATARRAGSGRIAFHRDDRAR